MIWVGVTGGIASGKSTVAKILQSHGFKVIDADQLAKLAVSRGSEGLQKVVLEFGPGVLTSEGDLDRKKMGELVFANPFLRQKLEQIVHPIVQQMAKNQKQQFETAGEKVAFYDVPLLFENQLESSFDKVLVIGSHESMQIERIQLRNQLTKEQAFARVQAQIPLAIKKSKASYYIENNGSVEELEKQVLQFLKALGISL